MGSRFWLSGVQLGMLQVVDDKKRKKILKEIFDKQYLCLSEDDRFKELIKNE